MKKIIVVFALLLTSNFTYSSAMRPDDFSGAETLIDFNLLAVGEKLHGQFSSSGIIFNNSSRFTEISNSTFEGVVTPNSAFSRLNSGGFQEFIFTIPVNLFGLELDGSEGGTFKIDVYGSSGMIESLEAANNSFLGVHSTTDITRIAISPSISGYDFVFDDVRFESLEKSPDPIPVPSSIWLFFTGLISLFKIRKQGYSRAILSR